MMYSQACKNAIRAVIYLSVHATEEEPVGTNEISDALGLTRHFLAKTMQRLSKQKLVSSQKGRNGGFYLNQENRKKKLADVIRAIDGQEVLSGCVLGFEKCNAKNPCVFHENVVQFREDMNDFLISQNLDNIADVVRQKNYKI